MNMLLLDDDVELHSQYIVLKNKRQIQHVTDVLNAQVGEAIKVGWKNGERFVAEILALSVDQIRLSPQQQHEQMAAKHDIHFAVQPPAKLPVTLILALPRPKVLRRVIQDSVSMGVEKIVICQSYFVEKSYWQSPILQQLDDAIRTGLEQAQDTIVPEIVFEKRFKPFVEDSLAQWITADKPAFVAHPYAEQSLASQAQACFLVIGCERGFTPYEIDLLQRNGCQIRQFGQRILRTETSVAYALGRMFA
ncbi:MAG: RsmE family RNA methyltransferase [Acinetobacter sp.]|nr:RsmE family RNA methyltransferase [Acinetobacter sp.]